MIAASIIEMPTLQQGSAPRAGVGSQTSDQPPQAFSDSLHAAARASSEPATANDGDTKVGRRQKPTAQDVKAPVAVPDGSAVLSPVISPQTVLPQQVLSSQQALFTDPSLALTQISLGAPLAPHDTLNAVAAQPMRDVASVRTSVIESNAFPSGVVQSDGVQSSYAQSGSDSLRALSILPGAEISGTKAVVVPCSAGNTVSSIVANAVPNEVSHAAATVVQTVVPNAAFNAVQNSPLSSVPNAVAIAVQNTVANTVQNSLPKAVLEVVSSAVPNLPSNAGPPSGPHTAPNAAAKGSAAPSLNPVVTDYAVPSAPAPEQSVFATGLSVPPTTADQLAALAKLSGRSLVTGQASVSNPNSASIAKPSATIAINAKDLTKDGVGLKQHDKSTPVQAESQTGAQNATSSGDQSQSDSSSQGQSGMPTLMNSGNHAVAPNVHMQNTAIASPVEPAPTLSGAAGHVAKTPDNTASTPNAAPEALPVINTAKLIQSMGRSEMRVGMRSNEFGNISISTSATRDLISAHISLDHGDLAKALATHLPEMQTRLGSNHAVNVRIDMNGQGAGRGTGTSGGMSNGSADDSRSGRQNAGSAASSGSERGITERQSAHAVTAMATGDRLNARLDIRV